MNYEKPYVALIASAVETITSAQQKDFADPIDNVVLQTRGTRPAYEADE